MASLHSATALAAEALQSFSGTFDGMANALATFTSRYGHPSFGSANDAGSQRAWDSWASKQNYEALLSQSNQVHRARLLAAASPHTGAWLQAAPVPALGLHLDADTIRVAVALRIGAPVVIPHPCRCGSRIDRLGHHPLSCRYSSGRLPRHANLNDVVKRGLAAAGVPSWLEPVGLDRGDGRRPDGITIFPYRQGRSLCWDATCVDTFSRSALVESAIEPGRAAAAAEVRKRQRYEDLTNRHLFEPLAVETSGVVGPSSTRFLNELGSKIRSVTGERRETEWLYQRVSVAIARGNAAALLASGIH